MILKIHPPPNLLERSRTQGAASVQVEVNGDINNVFPVNEDDNGRIVGRFENDKVVNISKRALSDAEISVLSKGLKGEVHSKIKISNLACFGVKTML